ncbi:MAG: glycosyltransferase [Candidatus Omnitrophota bacterium]|jgi:glycosyltransferase involved in cell wall biosynthesis|nr:MAG: glycosyltransferase [Candidatus Omnitrophota bacterium]
MKIALFHNLPSGGALRAAFNFVKYITGEGHICDIFTASSADTDFMPFKSIARSVKIFHVKKGIFNIRSLLPGGVSLKCLENLQKKIAREIDGGNYDFVFIEQDRFTFSPFLLKYINSPNIYYCPQPYGFHEAKIMEVSSKAGIAADFRNIIKRAFYSNCLSIDRENARFAKHILTNSHFSRSNINKCYGRQAQVCYLGVDMELFRPLNYDKSNFVISVGRCTPAKGFDFIINSLGLIKKEYRPDLIIVSDIIAAFWKKYLIRLAAKNNVSIKIKSRIGDSELVNLYNRARLCVYAPYQEPFGLAPVEAMACGTAVVAVREGGVAESIINGKTGYLAERNESIFADTIFNVISDSGLRDRLETAGIASVRERWSSIHAGRRVVEYAQAAFK